ncbi:hypothetical protein [Bacillus sp. NTK034]|uniref:hypothetical protein n=1 Tax=Bacillus sp. NTK034 TaxID=2802176 RepID=UPI001A8CBD51|nr:hypothetical protein [Bacillus sp. NTK034]MBN8203559.1 hypothetical protein [Bacillus sp. NTK034]
MEQPDFALTQGWWYPAILGLVLISIVIFMSKKRICWKEIYIIFGLIGYIVWMVDITIAVPLDLFDIGDPQKEGLPELLLFGIIPSCLSVIYLNFYKNESKWFWVILFVILSLILEWLTVKVGLMKRWNTWWSTPVHFIAYAFFLPWLLKFIKSSETYQK